MFRTGIETAIKSALSEMGAGEVSFVVERPSDMAHGDYATNAALAAAKVLKKNPREVADALAVKLLSKRSSDLLEDSARPFSQEALLSGVEKIEVAGAGFINFYLSHEALATITKEAVQDTWGKGDLYAGKKVMVEYTDPNPFKEFHIGHLMSNAIGESIARLIGIMGANVIRANYQGDVGPHVAKAIWGKKQKPELSWGAAYAFGTLHYEENKQEIDSINRKVYEKTDQEINKLYEEGRNLSLDNFERIYKILGTTFTPGFYFFESETWENGLKIVNRHIHDGIFEKSENAIVFSGERVGLHTRVFINSQGLPTYEAKDLGLLEAKQERMPHLDQSISITANEQSEYFKVMLAAAQQIPELKAISSKTKHISHGLMRFASGKMSSRSGNVISGESLISELTDRIQEKKTVSDSLRIAQSKFRQEKDSTRNRIINFVMNKLFDHAHEKVILKSKNKNKAPVQTESMVSVAAIKYTILKQGTGKDIIFDPERSLSLEGDSGPYLQYALVRARSLLAAAKDATVAEKESNLSGARSNLAHLLVHFPDTVARAAKELEPHHVVTYLTELASAFNSWYAAERLIIDDVVSKDALALVQAVEHTLHTGLNVLGIPAPQEM